MQQDADRIAAFADALASAGALFHTRGWVPATGGNFSARLDAARMLITASGVHKGELRRSDFLVADLDGIPEQAGRKTSYETGLHTQLYRFDASIGAVLHVHSIANTVLSKYSSSVRLSGYELLKLLPGIVDPQVTVEIPVFGNDQDIARLSREIDAHMKARSVEQAPVPAYLIAGHGLYVWGDSVAQTRHRLEALEFMFECELHSGVKR
jgi:methylthioribulose-1-phosphate dehydratase